MKSIIARFGVEALEVERAQPREVEAGLEVALDPVAELGLGDLAALEHEQRVVAVLLGGEAHRLAELLERDAGLLLVGEEALLQRRGEHAAEVADQDASHAAAGGSLRSISS